MTGTFEEIGMDELPQDDDANTEVAVVQVDDSHVLVFGDVGVPAGFEPVDLNPSLPQQQALRRLGKVLTGGTNTAGKVAAELAKPSGTLYRLGRETQKALNTGGKFMKSGNDTLGIVTSQKGQISNVARLIPVQHATSLAKVASAASGAAAALAMIQMQMQLNQIEQGIESVKEISQEVLREIRADRRATVLGLSSEIQSHYRHAKSIGRVTREIFRPIESRRADILAELEKSLSALRSHQAHMNNLSSHTDRDKYLSENGPAIIDDAHCVATLHKTLLTYDLLRIGSLYDQAGTTAESEQLAMQLAGDSKSDFEKYGALIGEVLRPLETQLSIIALLPGRKTGLVGKNNRAAKTVAPKAEVLASALQRIYGLEPEPGIRNRLYGHLELLGEQGLSREERQILNCHLENGEHIRILAELWMRRGLHGHPVLLVATSKRMFMANLNEFRRMGELTHIFSREDLAEADARLVNGIAELTMPRKSAHPIKVESRDFHRGRRSRSLVQAFQQWVADRPHGPLLLGG